MNPAEFVAEWKRVEPTDYLANINKYDLASRLQHDAAQRRLAVKAGA